jgi:hypothetical protein
MNVEFSKKKIEDLMEELKDKRPVFNSEDDFKFSLAWLIKEKYENNVDIWLERKMNKMNNKDASSSNKGNQNNKNQRVDIFIIVKNENDMEKIGIELKYFTANLEWHDDKNDEYIILKEQLAYNYKCYDAWHDVERLENFIRSGNINKGFAIWLTNIKSLTEDWDKVKKKIEKDINKKPNYYDFYISNNREIPDDDYRPNPKNGSVELKWDDPSKKGIKGRENPITIKGNYKVYWKEYSILNLENNNSYKKSSNNIFKYNLLEIQ